MSLRARLGLYLAPLTLAVSLPSCAKETAPPLIPPPSSNAPFSTELSDEDEDFDLDEVPEVEGDATIQALVRSGYLDNRVMKHLRHLTETVGPRLTGSHGLMQAEAWCRKELAGWGLKARLERWGEIPVGFDRGPWSGGMVTPEAIDYDFTTPAWSPGVFEAVPGRAVIYPRSRAAAKSLRKSLEGAWVVRAKDHGLSRELIEKIDAELDTAKIAGIVRADRHGSGELVHTSGRSSLAWEELARHVTIVLRGDQHADLEARLERGEEVTLAFSVDNRFFRGPVPQHNVVADLVGSELPDEYVIVGGHLDSWDGATGANDNATGVATTMEAARLLASVGARPRRTIRFVLWTGEEQGLLGSRGYVKTHAEEMDQVSAVFVHDMGTNYLSGIGATPEMMPQMNQVFSPVLELSPDEMPFALRETESLELGGSDHSPFIRAGVPGFFWDQDGRSDYSRVHHTQLDVLDNVIEDYQRHSAMVVAIAAYQVANLPAAIDRTNSAPIPRRRMGVSFGGSLTLDEVVPGSVAAKAGWKPGDRVVEIDGKALEGMGDLFGATQSGRPLKTVVVERRGKRITTTMDWSDSRGEDEREARRRIRGQTP